MGERDVIMKSFRLHNIKSFVDSGDIEIKPITIFVGKNSCGKSSLLRFLAVLAQTFSVDTVSPIKFYGKSVDYGNFESVSHKRLDKPIRFELVYDVNVVGVSMADFIALPIKARGNDHSTDMRAITISVEISKANERLIVTQILIKEDKKILYSIRRKNETTYIFEVNYIYQNGDFMPVAFSEEIEGIEFTRFIPVYQSLDWLIAVQKRLENTGGNQEIIEKIENFIKLNKGHIYSAYKIKRFDEIYPLIQEEIDAYDYYSNILDSFYNGMLFEAKHIHYIGPFRAAPDRFYRDPEYRCEDVGAKGENISNILINNFRDAGKKKRKHSNNQESQALEEILGYKLSLKNLGGGLFQIMIEDENGFQSNLTDTGYGVSQILPIVVQLTGFSNTKVPKDILKRELFETVLIEQPELHLHPAAQAELATLFASSVTKGTRKNIIIETHSEHLIRKLQVYIADKNHRLTNDMVKIYYVDKGEDGVASVQEMKIDEHGRFLTEWPSGFFDKGHELSSALLEKLFE